MTVFEAIVYGVVQGVGEFLPISSTAHIIAVPWLLGWKDPGLAFDVALHIGTLVAVIAFFWKDWVNLIYFGITKPKTPEGKLFWYIVLATVPGAVLGYLFENQVETTFRNAALIGIMLIVMGVILYIADRLGRKKVEIENVGLADSLIIGISQSVAFIPGVSRSGITMSSGLFLGLTRESAARFSFLLSTPIIFGTGVLKIKDIAHTNVQIVPFAVAVVTAAAVGLLSIKFLLDYLKKKGFGIFAIYRLLLGILLIAVYFIRQAG